MEKHAFNPSIYKAQQADLYDFHASCLVEKKINLKMLSNKIRKNKRCSDKGKVIYRPFCLSMMHAKDVERTEQNCSVSIDLGHLYLFMCVYEYVYS